MPSVLNYLDGSDSGKGIVVTATASNTQTIHTSDATDNDMITLYAAAVTSDTKLTLEIGGVTTAEHVEYTVPFDAGLQLVLPQTILADGVILKAFAATGSQVRLWGFVERDESTAQTVVYSRDHVSGSTSGKPIDITKTSSAGDTIHTSASGTTPDSIWLWAANTDTTDRTLTVEFGSTSLTWTETIPAESGPVLICPGLPLTASNVVRAFASVANVVKVWGYYIRST